MIPGDLTDPSSHLLGRQTPASSPQISLFLKEVSVSGYGSFMMRSSVIRNGYDDMGSLRNAEIFDDIAGPANDMSGQGYDFVPSHLAEKVRNNDVETSS